MRLPVTTRNRVLFVALGATFLLLLLASLHEDVRARLPANPFAGIVAAHDDVDGEWTGGDLLGPPPTYARFTNMEKALPQHNLDLPYPEGRTGRYVKFSNQIKALGWNNVMNEM